VSELPRLRHRVLWYGPRPADEVAAKVRFGDGTEEPPARRPRRFVAPSRPTIHVLHRPTAKADVHVVLASPSAHADDVATSEVLAAYLWRRAFDEIRGARALAYRVRVGLDTGSAGDEVGLWSTVQAQPDKVASVLPNMLAVLRPAAIDAEQLARARDGRRERIRSQRVDPRQIADYVVAWERRGLDCDPAALTWVGLPELTETEAGRALTRRSAAIPIVAIVGDTARMDLEALGADAEIVVHQPDELFAWDR
jgi:hypothetical protein